MNTRTTETAEAPRNPNAHGPLPTLSPGETAAVVGDVLLPVLAGGVVVRRPRMMSLVERTGWDRRGIEKARALRNRYGPDPLPFSVRGHRYALVLEPEDAHRVLSETPETFTPATPEKRGALAQFQPHGLLISDSGERAARRSLAEDVLDTPQPLHRMAEPLTATVREEARRLLAGSERTGRLTWDDFNAAWWRTVRRIVLGDAARDDETLTAQLQRLRAAANWSVLSPRRKELRTAFLRRVRSYVETAAAPGSQGETGGLASLVARTPAAEGVDPAGQIPHWLFAYDAAGMATMRALALLATHPEQATAAREEARAHDLAGPRELPYLRGCALESVRLWPTTPLILRESNQETTWRGGTVPAHTTFALYTPYLHRGEPAKSYGDSFAPHLWTEETAHEARANPALLPFSSGAAGCPGENLVLLTTSTFLEELLSHHAYTLASHPELRPTAPVPATLDHFALRFRVHRDG
ncbi:cytochrome P450 [Streptomyces daliensis]